MTLVYLDETAGQGFPAVAGSVLTYLQRTLGLDHWAVGRLHDPVWQVLSSTQPEAVGHQSPWQVTLCAAVLERGAPWAAGDVDLVPQLAAVRDALGLELRAFVTVPLRAEDGRVLGTLCGTAAAPVATDFEAHREHLHVLAAMLAAVLRAELRAEAEARHRAVAELDAQTDPLTRLGNRRHWDHQLALEEQRCRRHGGGAAVLTVDVDGLKVVNDRWGHDGGDVLLRQLADVLRQGLEDGDVAARLGGDEFAVLLPETTEAQAVAREQLLVAALEAAQVPASVGLAVRGPAGLLQSWREADERMYERKRRQERRDPPRPVTVAAPFQPAPHSVVVAELLSLAREHTQADIAFLGRFEGDVRVMRAVDSDRPLPLGEGHRENLETTYCRRVLDGTLPAALPDTSLSTVAQALPVTQALPIGGYLGVPVTLPDGRLYGSLCCVSHAANPRFDQQAVALLTSVARSLSRVLDGEEAEQARRRAALVELDTVLAQGRVWMAYQPVVDLGSGEVVGHEALARFEDANRSVTAWFAQAARVGRTADLELCTAARALVDRPDRPGPLWVNLSASVLVSPAAISLLAAQDLGALVVEISEHEQVDDYDDLRRVLAPLRAQGLRLAVDDAGAGFSSLRHVLELSPDVIKLDLSLVRGVADDASRKALVAALLDFARRVGAEVVAEGVETAAEQEVLRAAGVRWGQGFHLGRPRLAPRTSPVPPPRPAPVGRVAEVG